MKSYYLREERVPFRNLTKNGIFFDESLLLFKWAMIEKNKYIVIKPRFFKNQAGDKVTIMTEKQFVRHFRNLNVEAK